MKLFATLTSAFAITALLSSCGDSESPETRQDHDDQETSGSVLEAVLLEEAPAGAITITEARKNPTPGTEVVFSGKVMGRAEPFVSNRALVLLGDPHKLVSCDLNPGDDCEMPWDVCCETAEDITAAIATIRIVDEEGRIVKQGLKGLGGMKELSSVVVKGTIAEGSNPDNFIVDASGIHVAMVEATKENPAGRSATEAP